MIVEKLSKYFPYRKWRVWQRDIANFTYKCLENREIALIEAPTGIGKTSAILSAVLSFCEDRDLKIIYLVRTKNEAQAPIRELLRLRDKGVYIPFTIVRNRLDMCCISESRKLPYEEFLEECRYLRGQGKCPYYNSTATHNLDEVLNEVLQDEVTALKFRVKLCNLGLCPYEFSRQVFSKVKLVIMTYYYIFTIDSPEILDIDLDNAVLIIDEAHNLPDVITNLNTYSINELTVKASISDVKKFISDEELKNQVLRSLKNVINYMVKFRDFINENSREFVRISINDVLTIIDDIDALRTAYLEIINRKRVEGVAIPYTPLAKILNFYKRVVKLRSGFHPFITVKDGALEVVCRCVDPAIISSQVFNKVYSAILTSATLPPSSYVTSILGIDRYVQDFRITFREYVSKENYVVSIVKDVTTRYVERSEQMYEKVGKYLSMIYKALNSSKAILAIFPSYNVLKSVRKFLDPDVKYVMELSGTDIEQVIEELKRDAKRLILAVAGGKLVEGVEFRINEENIVNIVVIVGVPYPEPSDYLDMFIDIVSTRINDRETAWEIAYLWSAVIKIKQAIGRAFRSSTDKAYVVLMDKRYVEHNKLFKILNDYFGEVKITTISDVVREISQLTFE